MKLGTLAGGTCRVCGSDTYGAEIGCGCIHMYHQAGFIVLRNHDKDSLEYNWGIEMNDELYVKNLPELSLRDLFAMNIIQGFISNSNYDFTKMNDRVAKNIIRCCYDIADYMLLVRNENQ